MTKTLRISLLLLALFVFTAEALHAQGWRDKPVSSRNYVGFELGLNNSLMSGNENFFFAINDPYVVSPSEYVLPLPFVSLGSGLGYHIAGTLDLSLSSFFGLQAKIFYRTNNVGNTSTHSQTCSDSLGTPGTAEVEDNYKLKLAYFGISAALRLQFVPESFYGIVGFDYGANASSNFSGYQKIVSSTNNCQFLYYPTRAAAGTQIDIPEQSASNIINKSQFDLRLGVGTFIKLGDNGWVLTPEINVGIPLSEFFNQDIEAAYKNGYPLGDPLSPYVQTATTPKLWYASFSVALKFPFGGSVEPEPANVEPTKPEEPDAKYVNLKGKVSDAGTGEPIKAKVTVVDLQNNKVVSQTKTDNDGLYDIRVKAPGRYSVTADADGYLFGSTVFTVDDQGRILKGNHDIKLANSTNGRTRLLIFFDFNKSNLQPESYPELERAVAIMKSNTSMEVEIAGYTDNIGGNQYNLDLSRRRANEVRDYLVRHNIETDRITAKGYGEASPIAPNDNDEGRSENRRVEFVVLKK